MAGHRSTVGTRASTGHGRPGREASPDAVLDLEAHFDDFYAAWAPRVRGLVRHRVHDEDLVDDVVQETMMRAYRHALHLEVGTEPWRWLSTVARNLCLDTRRRMARRPEVPLGDGDGDLPTSTLGDPESQLDLAGQRRLVEHSLAALPEPQRRMFVMRHVLGKGNAEIAEAEGMTLDALKSALVRARRAFREAYVALGARNAPGAVVLTGAIARRFRSLRDRVRADVAEALGATGQAFGASMAGAIAAVGVLGAAAIVAPLLVDETPATVRPTSVEVSRPPAPVPEGVPDAPVGSPAPRVGDPGAPDAVGPSPPAESPAPPPPVTPGPGGEEAPVHVHARAGTGDLAPLAGKPPLDGSTGGDFEHDDEGFTLTELTELDVDGDGNPEVGDETRVGFDCPPPEERGAATGLACPVYEDVSPG